MFLKTRRLYRELSRLCTKVDSDERLECDPDMATLASLVAGRRWSANQDQRHSVHTVTEEKK